MPISQLQEERPKKFMPFDYFSPQALKEICDIIRFEKFEVGGSNDTLCRAYDPAFNRTETVRQINNPNDPFREAYEESLNIGTPWSLTLSTEARATAFFFRNFVLIPRLSFSQYSHLDYLVPLYNSNPSNSTLHLATHAVALSALGNWPGNAPLKKEASITYGRLLRKLNMELRDAVTARTDETLLSVLLCALFEAMNSTSNDVTAWTNHIDGAVALVKLRGSEQFKSEQALNLFRAVRTSMLGSCLQRGKPVDDFPSAPRWTCDDPEEQNAANRLTLISLRLPGIGARAKEVLARPKSGLRDTDLTGIIRDAQDYDAELQDWALSLSEPWSYRTVAVQQDLEGDVQTADQWPGPVHVYEDLFIANQFNDYRTGRIFCQSSIIALCHGVDSVAKRRAVEPCRRHAHNTIQIMVDEICASVPYHMRLDLRLSKQPILTGQDADAAAAMGGFCLIWPLYIASNAECVPALQRKWLRARLEHIGRVFGLTKAHAMIMAKIQMITNGASSS